MYGRIVRSNKEQRLSRAKRLWPVPPPPIVTGASARLRVDRWSFGCDTPFCFVAASSFRSLPRPADIGLLLTFSARPVRRQYALCRRRADDRRVYTERIGPIERFAVAGTVVRSVGGVAYGVFCRSQHGVGVGRVRLYRRLRFPAVLLTRRSEVITGPPPPPRGIGGDLSAVGGAVCTPS